MFSKMDDNFYRNLKKYRVVKGYTQQDIATEIGVSLRQVQRWEKDVIPDISTIQKLSDLIDYDLLTTFQDVNIVNEPMTALEKSIRKPKISTQVPSIPFLPVKTQGGYVKNYDQVQYMDTLEKYALPPGVDPRGAEWMYFEVDGDSMEGTFFKGDIIMASLVPMMDWEII